MGFSAQDVFDAALRGKKGTIPGGKMARPLEKMCDKMPLFIVRKTATVTFCLVYVYCSRTEH